MGKYARLVSLFVIALAACNKPASEEGKKNDKAAASKSDDEKPAKKSKDDDDKPAKKSKADDDEPPPKPADPPVCTVNATKVWGKGVNTLTGLTAVQMNDGRTAIGYATGNTPQVLVVGQKGEGKQLRVDVAKDSTFAAKAPKGAAGTRAVFRVTPVKLDDKAAKAFVDFRDDYKTEAVPTQGAPLPQKSRRVVCGPTDSGDKWVQSDYANFIDDPAYGKDPVTALKNAKLLHNDAVVEMVRDCRTFYDPKKDETWIVGSELRFKQDANEKVTVESVLFVEQGKQQKEKPLHTTPIKADAFKVVDYEVPISHELADGSFVVAARVGGSALVAAMLEHDKSVRGAFKTYQGYFNMPDASEDGPDDVLIASLKTGTDAYALRAMRIPGATKSELPAQFSKVTTDEDDSHSESRPEFIRDAKGQRWVAYIENAEKGKGHLEIIPVNAGFRATGKPYSVTKEEERATEARLVPQKDGGFVVVYIRDAGGGVSELVTEDLDCKVSQ